MISWLEGFRKCSVTFWSKKICYAIKILDFWKLSYYQQNAASTTRSYVELTVKTFTGFTATFRDSQGWFIFLPARRIIAVYSVAVCQFVPDLHSSSHSESLKLCWNTETMNHWDEQDTCLARWVDVVELGVQGPGASGSCLERSSRLGLKSSETRGYVSLFSTPRNDLSDNHSQIFYL